MPASSPLDSLDKLFGKTETKGRDSKADLKMLQKELGSYTVEQVAGLSETEGSAVKEFADTIKDTMNSPQDCVDLFEATQAINTGWASLTNGPALTPAEQQKITECAQAIIVTQLRAKGMNLSIDAKAKAITVVNEPATWSYGGMTETLFIKNLGLDTAPAAQKAVDGSEHFIRQAQAMAARRPGTTAPGTIAVTSTPPVPGPGITTRIGETLDTNIITPLKNARTEHPELFWGGSIVAGSLALFGIYKLFSGKKAPRAAATAVSGAPGSASAPSNERGVIGDAWFNFRSDIVKKGMFLALGGLLMGGGILAYKKDLFGMKNKVEAVGTGIKDTIGKWIRDLIPGLPAAPTVPGVPVIPPVVPVLPGTPGRPIEKIPAAITGEQKKVREKTSSELKGVSINPILTANEFIGDKLEALGPQEALKYLRSTLTVPTNIATEADYKKVEDILSRGVALEKSVKEAKDKSVTDIKITLPGIAPEVQMDPSKFDGIQKLADKLTPSERGITKDMEWGDGTDGKLQAKMKTLQTAFQEACRKDATTPTEESNKKAILEPLWRKMVYDICMERVKSLLESTSLSTGKTLNITDKTYITDLQNALDINLENGNINGERFFIFTSTGESNAQNSTGEYNSSSLVSALNSTVYNNYLISGSILKNFNTF